MPDLAIPFPYGLGAVGLDETSLRKLLSFRLMVMAGTEDVDTRGPMFPKEPEAMRQGATRFERAHRYLTEARRCAERLGLRCAWTGIDIERVGHDGSRIAVAAAPIVAAALHGAAIFQRQLAVAPRSMPQAHAIRSRTTHAATPL